jgi:hypothetical protein
VTAILDRRDIGSYFVVNDKALVRQPLFDVPWEVDSSRGSQFAWFVVTKKLFLCLMFVF